MTARGQGGDRSRPITKYLERLRPVPQAVVRTESSTSTVATWTVRLGETHVFRGRADSTSDQCLPYGRPDQPPTTVSIQPSLSIAAVRSSVRDDAFSGRVTPARGQTVSLFRVEASGRRVLTSQGVVGADGTYRIERRFTGTGRFGFVASVPTSATNEAGSSKVRPTVVY